jgi:hypothetical protein
MILPGHGGFNGGEVVANALQTQLANTVYHYIGVELTTSLGRLQFRFRGCAATALKCHWLPLYIKE